MNPMILVAYMTFAFQGITFPLGNSMIIEIAGKYAVDTSIIGYLLSLSSVGGGIATLCGGYLLERYPAHKLLYAAIAFSVLSVVCITSSALLAQFALGMVFFGLGTWLLVVIGNYLIVRQYAGAKRSSQLNIANFFFSGGALFTPALCGYGLQAGVSWEYIFWLPFSLLLALTGLVGLTFSPMAGSEQRGGEQIKQQQEVTAGHWGYKVYLAAIALSFYCILEVGYTAWIVVHLREGLGLDIFAASMVLTTFYIFHAAGRVISGIVVKFLPLDRYILCCATIGLIAVSLIVCTSNYSLIVILTAVLAFGIAGLYPSIMSYGTLQMKNPSSRIITFFMSSGLVGAITGLLLTSHLKQAFGATASLATGAVAAGFIIICMVMTMWKRRKTSSICHC